MEFQITRTAKVFQWKLANHALLIASNLLHCNILVACMDCVHGCGCCEFEDHLFFHCQVARALWFASPWSVKWESLENSILEAKLDILMNPDGALLVHRKDMDDFLIYAAILLNHNFKIHNNFIFKNDPFSLEVSL